MVIDIAEVTRREQQLQPSLLEAGYVMKWELSHSELMATARLRKRVFCDELKWVEEGDGIHEFDEFDTTTTTIAVFDGTIPVACLRIHLPSAPWMACTTFKSIFPLSAREVKSGDSCEVSRLAIAPEYRRVTFEDGTTPADALYRTLFAFCVINHMRLVYMIISRPVLRTLQRAGLPCETLGPGRIMDDGVHALPARLDWAAFVQNNQRKNPARLGRFTHTLLLAQQSIRQHHSSSNRTALAMA